MVVKRRSRNTRNTKKRLNRSFRRTIKRVRKKKYSRKKKSKRLKRNKKQNLRGGMDSGPAPAPAPDLEPEAEHYVPAHVQDAVAAATAHEHGQGTDDGGEMLPREHRFILDTIKRPGGISQHIIKQHDYIWDIISTCNAPPELYQELQSISIPEINRRFIDSCRMGRGGVSCGIFKFKDEEMMMGKKWWIKSKAQNRLLLRKIIGDFIIAKGLDGISMPAFYGVMVQKDPEADASRGGSHEIISLRNNLTKDEYTDYRLVQQTESVFAGIHEMDESEPASVHDAITRIQTEGHQLAGDPGGDGDYRWETETFTGLYRIMNGKVFWVDEFSGGPYDIYLLLEHVPTALKMCDTYVGLHIMYLINTFPLDLGGHKYGVNFCVTEEGICSIIDCEIKGDTQVGDFFDNFSMISSAANFDEHVRMETYYNDFTEESLRGGVPCRKKPDPGAGTNFSIRKSNECGAVSYYYDKQKRGLFFLYSLLLTRKLTIENVSDYRMDVKHFTIEDVKELNTILLGDHFTRCEIPDQFEILDALLSL